MMGNLFSNKQDSFQEVAAERGVFLNTCQFLQEIHGRISQSDVHPLSPFPLKRVINVGDLESFTPPPRSYVKENSQFLAFEPEGILLTDHLINHVIRNLYDDNISLIRDHWLLLAENLLYAKQLICGTTKLLQFCFLTHLCKMLGNSTKYAVDIQMSRFIQPVTLDVPVTINSINTFCAAARLNPNIGCMIDTNFQQPIIIPFSFAEDTTYEYRGFVLDGNFIAIEESILSKYNQSAWKAMHANNCCFHESMHAANRQHHESFQNHTPQQQGLIPPSLVTNPSFPLEAGYAGELALWGMTPNWSTPAVRFQARDWRWN